MCRLEDLFYSPKEKEGLGPLLEENGKEVDRVGTPGQEEMRLEKGRGRQLCSMVIVQDSSKPKPDQVQLLKAQASRGEGQRDYIEDTNVHMFVFHNIHCGRFQTSADEAQHFCVAVKKIFWWIVFRERGSFLFRAGLGFVGVVLREEMVCVFPLFPRSAFIRVTTTQKQAAFLKIQL